MSPSLIVLYGLGAVACGLLHYPSGERPDVGGILGDYIRDLGSPEAHGAAGPEGNPLSSLEGVRGDFHLSLALSQIYIPDSGRLPAASARMWDTLRPIYAKVLPGAIEELRRLRALRSTDKEAFERDRTAARTRLATARGTLLPHTQEAAPLDAAVKMLAVLEQVDAELARL